MGIHSFSGECNVGHLWYTLFVTTRADKTKGEAMSAAKKQTAVYLRVSSKTQDCRSQEADLKHWAESQAEPATFFQDKKTGSTMERPAWDRLQAAVDAGEISRIVVWRLDRLGRTASGLTRLFDDLRARKVNLISLKDGLDLNTPAGRLMANVLASVAQFETEVRSERQAAGIAAAKERGVYRGRKPGSTKAAPRRAAVLRAKGLTVREISQALGVSERTAKRYLRRV
jgi:DNA invertase Pin-like site-specific DNA recombinase